MDLTLANLYTPPQPSIRGPSHVRVRGKAQMTVGQPLHDVPSYLSLCLRTG